MRRARLVKRACKSLRFDSDCFFDELHCIFDCICMANYVMRIPKSLVSVSGGYTALGA